MTAVLIASIVSDLTEWLDDIAANWWFLLLIFVIAAFDSVVPVVPSETTVIIGGVAAGMGNQEVALVILAGACGAFLGDNAAYSIGHRMSDRIQRYAARRPKTAGRLAWADAQIKKRGGLLLITARFIPGGRTALTISSGITRQPRAWFAGWVGVAAVIWATYAAMLGFVGGRTFQDNHTAAFLVAFGAAISITILIEVVRHLLERRRRTPAPEIATAADVVEEMVDQARDEAVEELRDR